MMSLIFYKNKVRNGHISRFYQTFQLITVIRVQWSGGLLCPDQRGPLGPRWPSWR